MVLLFPVKGGESLLITREAVQGQKTLFHRGMDVGFLFKFR
jgi:hypothetical protein